MDIILITVNRDLLFKRLEIFGLPEDVLMLIKDWLSDRLFYNFQANLNQRLRHHTFIKMQNYNVGNNILLNRMCSLNGTIAKTMMECSYLTFKIKCKELFLKN